MKAVDLDLDLVRCFLTVAETGGFTVAAKRLNLSQSAVSLKVQRLEGLLGCEVLIRTSRSLTLTQEGEIVMGYARRLLALGEEMVHQVAGPAVEGTLRLGVIHQFGHQFLPDLLKKFKRQYPKVRLSVEVGMTADLLRALEDNRLDMVLGAGGNGQRSGAKVSSFVENRVLWREQLVWVQAASSSIDLKADPLPLIAFPSPCGFRGIALDLLERARRTWQIVYSSTSPASIQAAVQADFGIAVLGESAVLDGMKVIKRSASLPALPKIAVSTYSRKSANETLVNSMTAFIEAALAA